MSKPLVEHCELVSNPLVLWIALPIILGVIVIQAIFFTIFVIRRRKKTEVTKWQEFQWGPAGGLEPEYGEDIVEEIEIPRPRLSYYRNPGIPVFPDSTQ